MLLERELCGTADEVEEQVREVLQRAGRVMLEPAFPQLADRTPARFCINTVWLRQGDEELRDSHDWRDDDLRRGDGPSAAASLSVSGLPARGSSGRCAVVLREASGVAAAGEAGLSIGGGRALHAAARVGRGSTRRDAVSRDDAGAGS